MARLRKEGFITTAVTCRAERRKGERWQMRTAHRRTSRAALTPLLWTARGDTPPRYVSASAGYRSSVPLLDATAAVEVGMATFSGPAWGGDHTLRLLATAEEDAPLYIEVDGRAARPRTPRGVRALLARMIDRARRRVS